MELYVKVLGTKRESIKISKLHVLFDMDHFFQMPSIGKISAVNCATQKE